MQRIDGWLEASQRVEMMFSRKLRDPVARGELTVSIRLWSRAQFKVGRQYPTAAGIIEIDSLEVLPFSDVTEDDVAASGEADPEALRARAARWTWRVDLQQ